MLNDQSETVCGLMVVCMDNTRRPCVRKPGHKGGHNPFSDSPTGTEEQEDGGQTVRPSVS
jgi:hypothetical protein